MVMNKSQIRIFYNNELEKKKKKPNFWVIGFSIPNCDQLEKNLKKVSDNKYKSKWI